MNRLGFALESSLFLMLLISALVVVTVSGVIPVVRTSDIDYRQARVTYAAEAGGDAIMAQLTMAMGNDGRLSSAELAAITAPSVAGFTYDAIDVQPIGSERVEMITDGPYAGLRSIVQDLQLTSSVHDDDGNRGQVVLDATSKSIPLFQFGVFYDKDLEVHPGGQMWFDGPVHSNGNIYLSAKNGNYYRGVITTPNSVIWNRKSHNDRRDKVYIADAFGNDVQLNFDSRSHPNPADFRNMSNLRFDNRLKTSAYGVDSLRLPLPDSVPPIALKQPRLVSDDAQTQSVKFAWGADWYIEIDMNSLGTMCNSIGQRDGGHDIPDAAACANIFTFTPDAWTDMREGRWMDVLDIDMNQLFTWSQADSAARTTQILYVTFVNEGAGPDPRGDGVMPVVRLQNGANLGNAITIATDRPMYIQGNYNVGVWQPAAIVADAMTWLSNAWNDAEHQCLCGGAVGTKATNTNYNMAVIAGHSETPWDWQDGGGNAPPGGALENYPRFLEDWRLPGPRRRARYRGSLVSLTTAVYATGPFRSDGWYYEAPDRDWAFDLQFEIVQNLPPGTPVVGGVLHTAFRPVY